VVVVLYADSLPAAGEPSLDQCPDLRAPGADLSNADPLGIDEWGRDAPSRSDLSPVWLPT